MNSESKNKYNECLGIAESIINDLQIPSPTQTIKIKSSVAGDISIIVKRDDLISQHLPGNKFRKLIGLLPQLQDSACKQIVTFGGAFSNHLYASASLAGLLDKPLICFVRGERASKISPILKFVEESGARLVFIDRNSYRQKDDALFVGKLLDQAKIDQNSTVVIPEGGTSASALLGVQQIVNELEGVSFERIACPLGTGGTAAGLALGSGGRQILAYSAIKGGERLLDTARQLIANADSLIDLRADYHFGGFARTKPELWIFIQKIAAETGLLIDPIYGAKCLFGLVKDIEAGLVPNDGKTVFLMTGGVPIDTTQALKSSKR